MKKPYVIITINNKEFLVYQDDSISIDNIANPDVVTISQTRNKQVIRETFLE